MSKKLPCYIVRDMLPQYAEDLLSQESAEDIKQHLDDCEECREIYRQMTGAEPEILEEDVREVDYLKKVRKNRRGIIIAAAVIVAMIVCGAFINSRIQAAKATINYDESSKTMVIYGKDDTDIKIPKAVNDANELDAQFDSFHLKVSLPILRTGGASLQEYLPEYLGRTNESLKFIRNYMRENCGSEGLNERADKYVDISIMAQKGYTWSELEDRIELEIGAFYWHREEMYVLSLLGSKNVQWKQLGYAWYLGSCLDPYSEVFSISFSNNMEELPYYEAYIRGGGTKEPTPGNYKILNDAVSFMCLTEKLPDGTPYEVSPLKNTALYSAPAKAPEDPGDEMSVAMATSFIAYLSDQYGFGKVSDFCFGMDSFEQSFGIDYQSAYDSWAEWIMTTYGE